MPAQTFEGHTAPIVSLAVSPDGNTIASASWDRTIRLWPLAGGAPRMLEGHSQNVNGVAFTADGKNLVSAGYDATVRIWPLAGSGSPIIVTLPAALNAVALAPDGEIAAAAADGRVFFVGPGGEKRDEVAAMKSPIISLAVSPDGALVAAAGIRGSVAIIERKSRTIARTLVGPGLPVWSVAFFPDSKTLLTGGTDRLVRRWDASSGEHIGAVPLAGNDDPLAAFAGDPGAEIYRACVACHTLSPDEGNRAGPTLAGIFGRKIAMPARLQFLRCAEKTRHRVDAGNGGEIVRGRARRLYARHQNAGTADRLGRKIARRWWISWPRGGEEIRLIRLSRNLAANRLPLRRIALNCPAYYRARADNRRWCADWAVPARRTDRNPARSWPTTRQSSHIFRTSSRCA